MQIFVLQVIFLIIFNISFGLCGTRSEHVVDSYFTAEHDCLHQYTLRIGLITKELKADSLFCLKEADIRLGSDKMFETLHNPMKKCFSTRSIKDYFKCVEDIAPENRKKIKEITTEKELFLQNIDKIEKNKTACLRKASSRGSYKSTNAVGSLNICLQSIPQPQMNSVKEKILVEDPTPPGDMNEFLNKLDEVKEKYNQLKNCTLDGNDYEDCFRKANTRKLHYDDEHLGYFLTTNSTEYFSKITEIDRVNDSCLRQYVVMDLNKGFIFDLKSCLMHGSKQSQESEENFEKDNKLIADLIEVWKEFSKCRDITEDLDTYDCVYKEFETSSKLREIQAAISRKSERNFKSFKNTFISFYTDQYPCIENLYDNLQFDGYNLRSMEKDILFDCLKKGFKTMATLPFEKQLIKELNEIQEYLKTCTVHHKSPGYKRCFQNIMNLYGTTWEYLHDKNSNYSEIVAKHDMHHGTCFEDIVKDITDLYVHDENLMPSKKCLFP